MMKYSDAVREYEMMHPKLREGSNAQKFLDDFDLTPDGSAITAEEARATCFKSELPFLESLASPTGPRIRDEFKIIPFAEWNDRIAAQKAARARNRDMIKLTLRQRVGSCASEGISGAIMALENKGSGGTTKNGGAIREAEKLNAYFLYGKVNGGRDRGSAPSDNLAAAIKYGVPSERVWSRSNTWQTRPSSAAVADALLHRPVKYFRVSNIEEYGTALFMGFPVYSGYPGHAWFGVDVLDKRRLLYKDSQGSTYGDDGFIVLDWDRIYWPYGAWAIQTVRRVASDDKQS